MPPRRKYKKTGARTRTRKRNYRRNYRRKNSRITTARLSSHIVPDKSYTVLNYNQRLTPAPLSGADYHQVFRGNSLYDPDYTGTGSQPVGFDEWMQFYKYYRVFSSSITVRVLDNSSTAAAAQWELCVIPSFLPTDFAATDPQVAAQNPFSKFRLIGTHTGKGPQMVKNYMSTEKMLGRSLSTLGSNAYGSSTADPASSWAWHIVGQVIDESTTMANVYVYVTIKYYCEFSTRFALAQS